MAVVGRVPSQQLPASGVCLAGVGTAAGAPQGAVRRRAAVSVSHHLIVHIIGFIDLPRSTADRFVFTFILL